MKRARCRGRPPSVGTSSAVRINAVHEMAAAADDDGQAGDRDQRQHAVAAACDRPSFTTA